MCASGLLHLNILIVYLFMGFGNCRLFSSSIEGGKLGWVWCCAIYFTVTSWFLGKQMVPQQCVYGGVNVTAVVTKRNEYGTLQPPVEISRAGGLSTQIVAISNQSQ